MTEHTLRNCRILVVEDEYMIADELQTELDDAAVIVLGPVGTLEDALELIEAEPRIDGAILDINLHGELVFPAADLLMERKVPFVFTTGYEDSVIPSRFAGIPRCEKLIKVAKVAQAIGRAMHA